MVALIGLELERQLKAAKLKLDSLNFKADEKQTILSKLHIWETSATRALITNNASKFRFARQISYNLQESPARACCDIAVMLLVCDPDYPEVVDYLLKTTRKSPLVTEWDSFATSAAWEPFREANDPATEPMSQRSENHQASLPKVEVQPPSASAIARRSIKKATSTPTHPGSVDDDYKFPLLTIDNKLNGYTTLTTLRPANKGIDLSSPYTLRVGWHKPTGAAVLGVLQKRRFGVVLYAAPCTIDERPVDAPTEELRPADVVFIQDFGPLNITALSGLLCMISVDGHTDESLQTIISRALPSGVMDSPLQDVAAVSSLSYGTSAAFPLEIANAVSEGRQTGLQASFAPHVEAFHRQLEVAKATSAPDFVTAGLSRVTDGLSAESITVGSTAAKLRELCKVAQGFLDKYFALLPDTQRRPHAWQTGQGGSGLGLKREAQDVGGGVGGEICTEEESALSI